MQSNTRFAMTSIAERCLGVLKRYAGWRPRPTRQLRLCETLALGERRFLAVVEFEQQRFLVGGTGTSVALLSQLPAAPSAAAWPKESRE